MTLRRALPFAAAVAIAFHAGAARGQAPQPSARHHDDLFLRIVIAKGLASMTAEPGGVGSKITSQPIEYRAAAGYALTGNIILFGELIAHEAGASTVTIGGVAPNRADGHLSLSGLGAGATYYWMPFNAYVALALAAVSTTSRGTIGSTDRGPAVDVAVGKEWWVTDTMGVGISAQLLVARIGEKNTTVQGEKPAWTSTGASLGLSVTFN